MIEIKLTSRWAQASVAAALVIVTLFGRPADLVRQPANGRRHDQGPLAGGWVPPANAEWGGAK